MLFPAVRRNTKYRRCYLYLQLAVSVSSIVLFCSTSIVAQTLYQTVGNAAAATTCSPDGFVLTPDAPQAAGAVWRRQQITLARSFSFTCALYFGTKDANGADGIGFTLQRSVDGITTLGTGSSNLGIGDIATSATVEFDTYNNGAPAMDIADDHIAIFKNGVVAQPVALTTAASGTATAVPALTDANGTGLNIEDGVYHPVRITWNANTKTLRVYFDGALRATCTEDFTSTVFTNNPLVYWGLTSGTGGLNNMHAACSLLFEYDQDADGYTDNVDTDDDNDGIPDAVESAGIDATGDADNDGVLNYQDSDFGALNAQGVVASLDFDGDGTINQFDLDTDADGIPDVVEGTDGRMLAGFRALYSAATGQYTQGVNTLGQPLNSTVYSTLLDTDSDGQPDFLDRDADGDRQPDWLEGFDDNSNGFASDDFAARVVAFVAAGGSNSFYPSVDANTNGIPDWLDDSNGDGTPNYLDSTNTYYHDSDGDGLVDLLDPSNRGAGYADVSGYPDKNNNGLPDYRDAIAVTPLPVELTSFEARLVKGQVLLVWTTASELNSSYFVPEASIDGRQFIVLGQVAAAGTSAQCREYNFWDKNTLSGTAIYYRLKQIDLDNSVHYSPVRSVSRATGNDDLSALVNPFAAELTLHLPLANTPDIDTALLVTDASGRSILTQRITLPPSTTELRIPQAAIWPAGVYLIHLTQNARHYLLRVAKQ